MHIKKLSHCCLVIEVKTREGNMRKIILDPGSYSIEEHRKVKNADIILISHEHQDHFHIESLKELVKSNPKVKVITNDAVGDILAKEGIEHHIMSHGDVLDLEGVHIEAYGEKHAVIHSSIPVISNVGFFIENKLFFPGDAFTIPGVQVDVLALPVSAPWLKISEAIDYALAVKPKIAFSVHDGVRFPAAYRMPEMILPKNGIEFIKLEEGASIDIK